jgi:DNA-binding XRE family transcriptional regulator
MNVQFIEQNGKPEFAVMPVSEYWDLLKKAEMLEDVTDYDKAKAELASGEDELVPEHVADALLDGDNPIKVWRNFRGLSQFELAERISRSQSYVAQLESGRRKGSIEVYRAIAAALRVDVDDLIFV